MKELNATADISYVPDERIRVALIDGWTEAADAALGEVRLSENEQTALVNFLKFFDISGDDSEKIADRVVKLMDARAANAAIEGAAASCGLEEELTAMATFSRIPTSDVRSILVRGWVSAAGSVLDDHIISRDEEDALTGYIGAFDISSDEVRSVEGAAKVVNRLHYSRVIRELKEGKLPETSADELPFNFMKSEALVWVFHNVQYLEDKIRRERVGGSTGGTVRVAKGVYIRNSSFSSRTVETEVTEHIDTGTLALTTKHMYFSGARKKFRVRFDRIVSFDSFSNGIGITRDVQNARMQTFVVDDAWFVCNLTSMLAERV